jgi:hypothetical protein
MVCIIQSIAVTPYPLIQYPRFTRSEKKLKLKVTNDSKVSKLAQGDNGP